MPLAVQLSLKGANQSMAWMQAAGSNRLALGVSGSLGSCISDDDLVHASNQGIQLRVLQQALQGHAVGSTHGCDAPLCDVLDSCRLSLAADLVHHNYLHKSSQAERKRSLEPYMMFKVHQT